MLPPYQKLGRVVRIRVEWQLCNGEGAVPYIMYSAKRILSPAAAFEKSNYFPGGQLALIMLSLTLFIKNFRGSVLGNHGTQVKKEKAVLLLSTQRIQNIPVTSLIIWPI